jgi:hypothetical protein
MIAPLRQTESRPQEVDTLARARRYVAEMLLTGRAAAKRGATPIVGWKAWLFVGWVTLVVVCYFGRMAW